MLINIKFYDESDLAIQKINKADNIQNYKPLKGLFWH